MKTLRSLLAIIGLATASHAASSTTQPVNDLATVGQGLLAVASAKDSTDSQLRVALITARDALPLNSDSRGRIEMMLSGELDKKQAEEIALDIAFTPTFEAPTPRGWPSWTPVGEAQLKQYPAYRMATVERGQTLRGGEFMTLFFHIQRKDIAMTGPVEMTMTDDDKPAMKQMSFLYENTDMGKLGEDGKVSVVDVPSMQAISVGARGDWSSSSLDERRKLIDRWLAAHPEYEPAGDLRVMGYNSPSMPRAKRYHEVQLPVKKRQ